MSRPRLGLLLLFGLTVIFYFPTLPSAALWDDTTLLRPEVLASWWGPLPFSDNYFRPLGVGTLLLEARVWGGAPTGHHLGNILLHALNAVLVAALLAGNLSAPRRDWAAPALAGLYALHPALVEGVAFISSRFDLLMTAGLLLALLADDRLRGWRRPLGVGAAYLLAALSKEGAATFPLVLLCWHLSRGAQPRARWTSYAAVVAAGLVYLGLRASALPALYTPGLGDVIDAGTPIQHAMLVAHSLARYLLLAVWPFGTLSPIQHAALPLDSGAGGRSVVAALAALAGAGALVRVRPRAGWLAVAGIAALLPAMNLVPLQLTGGSFVAERYLVFPMAFFVLSAGTLLGPALSWSARPLAVAGWLGWLAGAAVTMVTVQGHWQSPERLWTWAMQAAPASSLPATNLSEHLNATGRADEGLLVAQEAIRRDPDQPLPWNNTGQALFLLGQHADAEAHFREALQRDPDSAFIWANLGAALMEQGRLAEAEQVFLTEALPRDPQNPDTVLNLAGVYLKAGRPDRALEQIDGVLMRGDSPRAARMRADATAPEPWLRLSGTLLQQGDLPGSQRALDQAKAHSADPIEVGLSQSALLMHTDRAEEAFQLLKALQQQAPEDARIPFNTGIAVLQLAGPEIARGWFEQSAALAPDWPPPREQLALLPTP